MLIKDAKSVKQFLGEQQEPLVQKNFHIKMIVKAKHLKKVLYCVLLWSQAGN